MMEETKRNVQIVVNRDDLKFMVTEWIQEELAKHTQKQEVYLSRTKTALKLGVTLSTLWRWDKENYLNAVRVGSKVLYRESDIERVINHIKED
jgi:SHS2 domain-containing protein